jgi:hypothetical protein
MLLWDSSDGVWLITLIRLFVADKKAVLLATLSALAGDERANRISRVVLAHKQHWKKCQIRIKIDWVWLLWTVATARFCRKYFLMFFFLCVRLRQTSGRRELAAAAAKMRSTIFMTRLWNADKRRFACCDTFYGILFRTIEGWLTASHSRPDRN